MRLTPSIAPLEAKFTPFALDEVAADGVIEGYASLFARTDLAGDIVMPGAFAGTIAERGPRGIKMLFQHDPKEIVGVWADLAEDDRGLRVRGRVLADIQRGAELLTLLREGALDGLSIGFRTVEARAERASGLRALHKVELWEISLVTFPMLPAATVAGVKGRRPTAREFERWLTRDAGLTRSDAKAVISHGYKAVLGGREARRQGGSNQARLLAGLKRAAGLCTPIKPGTRT